VQGEHDKTPRTARDRFRAGPAAPVWGSREGPRDAGAEAQPVHPGERSSVTILLPGRCCTCCGPVSARPG